MQPVSRATVEAFYQAYMMRDAARVAPLLDDDIDWVISGPIDIMPFCGQRRGKSAVLELVDRRLPKTLEAMSFHPETLLIDGDRAAMLATLSAVLTKDRHKVRYRLAHFLRFRDSKLIEFRSIIDTFDAAEQILGHSIDLSPRRDLAEGPERGDHLFAV
jgi:ketosteroid isomerase-like protein